jgi:creatinine amidohydrolase
VPGGVTQPAAGEPVLWAKHSWPQLERMAAQPPQMVIWPLGTTEQHGRHMPTDVDIRNCWEVAEGVSARTGIPLLPPLAYGDSNYWAGWPGTLSLRSDTLINLIIDILRGVIDTGFRRVLLLNGHIGNGPTLSLAEARIREQYPELQVRALSWWDVSPRVIEPMRSFHANRGETAVYLTHSPERIDMTEAVDELAGYERPLFSYHSSKLTRTGVVGHPTDATAEQGREILDMAIEDLVSLVTGEMNSEIPPDLWQVADNGG